MKLKKLLALTLAGVMTAATLTACAPLEDLYDWFFGGGSSSASRGNGTGLVESETFENGLRAYFDLSETKASDRAKKTLEEVAEKFNATWLTDNKLNDTAKSALSSITQDKLQEDQQLCVDVMEVISPDQIEIDNLDNRPIYSDNYKRSLSDSVFRHYFDWKTYSTVKDELNKFKKDGVELYAVTFQKNGKTYVAMVMIRWSNS